MLENSKDMLSDFEMKETDVLITKATAGDEEAVSRLLELYAPMVKGKARIYYVAGAELEDVMQEGMIGLFKAIRSYDPEREASFKTYANLCITRQILTAIKRANTQKNEALNKSLSIDADIEIKDSAIPILETLQAAQDTNPEAILLMKEKMGEMENGGKNFFSKLEQQVLAEFLKGKSYVEIGELMGKSPKSIDNAIQRIRKKLESQLIGV